jgi:hypothetical protein
MKKRKLPVCTMSGLQISNIDKPIEPSDIWLADIAYGLSNIARFSGQSKFFTVAAHSIMVSEWIERNGGTPQEALWGLLHDASEAYINDLVLPVKVHCPEYYKIESNFMKAICKRFKLPQKQPDIVTTADYAVLVDEKKNLFGRGSYPWIGKHPKKEFIRRFYELGGK